MKSIIIKAVFSLGIWEILLTLFFLFAFNVETPLFNHYSIDSEVYKYCGIDSEVYKYCGRAINNGALPYVEYFDHKGPLIHFYNALGLLIHPTFGILTLEFLILFITLKLVLKFFGDRIIGDRIIGTGLFYYFLFFTYEGGNLTEVIALPFAFYFLHLGFINIDGNKPLRKDFPLFIVFFILFFNKANYAFPFIFYFPLRIFLNLRSKRTGPVIFVAIWGLYFLGYSITVMLISFLIYILIWDFSSFIAMIESAFIFNFKYSANDSNLIQILPAFFKIAMNRWYYLILIFGILLKLGLLIKAKFKDIRYLSISLIFDLLSIYSSTIGFRFYPHYDMMLLPAFFFSIFVIERHLNLKAKNLYVLKLAIVFLGFLFSFDSFLWQLKFHHFERWGSFSISTSNSFLGKEESENQEQWVSRLNKMAPNFSKVTMGYNKCKIYNDLNTLSSSRYFYPVTKLNGELLLPDYYKEVGENLVLDEVLILETGNLNIRLDSIESRMGKGLTAVYLFSDQIYGTPFDFYQIREAESVVQTHAKIERPISITHPSLP
jgi:hypothetical protein